MATKKQHFVPKVYLKAWETKVETKREPQKQFDGVYYFKRDDVIAEGATRETILWKPHLYTISFKQLYLGKKCPKVYKFFVNEVFNAMKNNSPRPVYGKLGYSKINTKKSVYKHLYDIDSWDFYYDDGTTAKKKALLNRFHDIRCYILEEAFSSFFEKDWENILRTFISEVKTAPPNPGLGLNRKISERTAEDMMKFFFMMLCRSPEFDAMGAYTCLSDILNRTFNDTKEVETMINDAWLSELYRMFYKENVGFYHMAFTKAIEKCQVSLFEVDSNAGSFITSDNPAFMHISHVEIKNMNGYYFPISPKHMLLIAKGSGPINVISYRTAKNDLVRKFNEIIASHSIEKIISVEKYRYNIL